MSGLERAGPSVRTHARAFKRKNSEQINEGVAVGLSLSLSLSLSRLKLGKDKLFPSVEQCKRKSVAGDTRDGWSPMEARGCHLGHLGRLSCGCSCNAAEDPASAYRIDADGFR